MHVQPYTVPYQREYDYDDYDLVVFQKYVALREQAEEKFRDARDGAEAFKYLTVMLYVQSRAYREHCFVV